MHGYGTSRKRDGARNPAYVRVWDASITHGTGSRSLRPERTAAGAPLRDSAEEGEDIPGDDIRPEPAIPVKEPYLPKPDDNSEETSPYIEEYPELEELDQRREDNSVSEIQAA